jgi:hypothetical protein
MRASRGASGDVHIHGQNLIDSLHDAVDVVHAARVGARTHGDDPLGLGHLFVKSEDHRGNLFKHRPGDNEQVCLPRGGTQHLGSESSQVVASGESRGLFDETAGKPEKHGPKAVLARPIDDDVRKIQEPVVG